MKTSRSRGNVVVPQEAMNRLGADVLRLWVAATDYRAEMAISDEILTRIADAYWRIRNTARFLLANLDGFDPEHVLELDRYLLDQAARLQDEVIAAYDAFQFHLICQALDPAAQAGLEPALSVPGPAWRVPAVAQIRNPRLLRARRGALAAARVAVREHCDVRALRHTKGRILGRKSTPGTRCNVLMKCRITAPVANDRSVRSRCAVTRPTDLRPGKTRDRVPGPGTYVA